MGWPEDMWDRSARMLHEFEREDRLARRLRQRLDDALVLSPAGYAVVLAAFDWSEAAGMPVPVAQLRQQTIRRMADLLPGRAMTAGEFDAGLAWAIEEPALLIRHDTVAYGDGTAYEIAEELRTPLLLSWRSVSSPHETPAVVTPLEAVAVGRAVCHAPDGDTELARRVWQKVAAGEDPDAATLAGWHLAEALRDEGDLSNARRAFERLIAQDHFATGPRAMLALAELEVSEAPDRAGALLEGAVASGHPLVVARAARLLASLRALHGDQPGVIDACRIAYEHGDPLTGPSDGLTLAGLLRGVGEGEQAERVLRQIIDLGDPLHTAKAITELAGVLVERGDLAGAARLLTEALAGECVFRTGLQVALAGVYFAQEDLHAAERTLAEARDQPVPLEGEEQARAGMLAAQLAVVRGEDESAARLFSEVLESDDPETVEAAHLLALACGEHLRQTGPCTIRGTEPLLRHLMTRAGSPLREWAAYGVGRIAHASGDLIAAGAAYRLAAGGGNPRFGAMAALQLAELPVGEAQQDEVLDIYLRIIEGEAGEGVAEAVIPGGRLAQRRGRRDAIARIREHGLRHATCEGPHAAAIAFALGALEADVFGSSQRAIPMWELAAASGDPEVTPVACFNLGVVRARWLAPLMGARDLQRAIATGHPEFAPRAMLALGMLAEELYDLDASTDAYLQALNTEHPRVRLEAAFRLACLVQHRQPEDAEAALHEIIESAAPEALVGAAYAQLGRIYALQGNRRLAQRYWRRGKRHPDPEVVAAFTAERAAIGRVSGPRHRES